MTIECVRCGQVFTGAQAFADHDPKCECRPLVSSPDEWRWRTVLVHESGIAHGPVGSPPVARP